MRCSSAPRSRTARWGPRRGTLVTKKGRGQIAGGHFSKSTRSSAPPVISGIARNKPKLYSSLKWPTRLPSSRAELRFLTRRYRIPVGTPTVHLQQWRSRLQILPTRPFFRREICQLGVMPMARVLVMNPTSPPRSLHTLYRMTGFVSAITWLMMTRATACSVNWGFWVYRRVSMISQLTHSEDNTKLAAGPAWLDRLAPTLQRAPSKQSLVPARTQFRRESDARRQHDNHEPYHCHVR